MYLVSLKLQEDSNDKKIIRYIKFNKTGLNIVVDETRNGKGNNVGKTTFLRVIDICLGARDKKYLWTDFDTGSVNNTLKEYIKSNRVFAELVISNDANNYTLIRELFPRGSQYINGEKFNYDNYRYKLNEIFFQLTGKPQFRQLIGKFVRIKQTDDSYGTLSYLHSTTSHNEYRNIYDFLFKLNDIESSSRILELSQFIRKQKDLKDDLLKAHSIESLEELSERQRLISNEVSTLEIELDRYISLSKYKNDLDKISDIKKTINEKSDLIDTLNFKINKIKEIINIEEKSRSIIDDSLLKEFYNDITKNIEGIKIKFDELIKFNQQIRKNKINYYTRELKQLKKQLISTNSDRNELVDKNSELLNLLEDDNFEKYKFIHEKLLKNKESLGELNEVKTAYENILNNIHTSKTELEKLEEKKTTINSLEIFNDYFSELSKKILGQRLYLAISSGFPLKISNIDDGVGTGHRKTITLLLDISYVYLLKQLNINHPYFFIHDVLESIDEHNMESIVNAIDEVKAQFVFAILNEKISDYNFIKEKDIILKLSEDEKLFKI